ncbi:hypothetical protein [Ureibacillus manganicus]|nr:hypothetical protein [Ureibacillus manganicus]
MKDKLFILVLLHLINSTCIDTAPATTSSYVELANNRNSYEWHRLTY